MPEFSIFIHRLSLSFLVLVMDEATANVDMVTDQLIQKTVRDCFNNCTVLTIAHRLRTIIDFDRVVVMEAGQIVEYGEPHDLLQAQWHFYNLVSQTGKSKLASKLCL